MIRPLPHEPYILLQVVLAWLLFSFLLINAFHHHEHITLVMLPQARLLYSIHMNSPSGLDFDGPAAYQITVRGMITPAWSGRLEGMTINRLSLDDGTIFTVLTGELTDQAALSGVLNTLYDLQLPLVAVNKLPLAGSH